MEAAQPVQVVEAAPPAPPVAPPPQIDDESDHMADSTEEDVHAFDVVPGGSRLGELLVDAQVVKRSQLVEALLQQAETGMRIGHLLVELGLVNERPILEALGRQHNLNIVDLRGAAPKDEALELIPEALARELNAVPLALDDKALLVAVSEPIDEQVRQRLSSAAGRHVALVLAPSTEIRGVIDSWYKALTDVERHVRAFEATDRGRGQSAEAMAASQAMGDDAPVVQLVQKLLTQALRDRASDIHIEPQDKALRVRFRVDGALHEVLSLPAAMSSAMVSRIKILAGMNIVERRRSQDGQIAINIDGRPVDIRVATTATIWGEKCVMRLLDKGRAMLRLDDLGMPEDTHETFSRTIRSPFGMVLCAGPTGSGKTTTLYASLMELDEPHRNIMTIEDPVEYVVPTINQIQTNEQAGVTFAGGLKAILRQDPDVVLVGEIRDVETARIATQSALTGHFVLSTLHATDAVSALHRLLDMGIESFLIASSVIAVVGQRLVRRVCPACKVPYQPSDEELAFYLESTGGVEKDVFYHGAGCNYCSGTGYQDRIGVYEMLKITPEIKRLVVGWATQEELRRLAVSQGMRTLRDEAIDLVRNDQTTIAEVIRSIYVA
jgi:type IV pilus assembly protein PilB